MARERLGQPTEIELEAWELTNKGVSLGTLGRLDEERVSYEASIRVKPDYAPAWFNQAAAMGASGHPGEAIEYADVALHLNPASVPALINKAPRCTPSAATTSRSPASTGPSTSSRATRKSGTAAATSC